MVGLSVVILAKNEGSRIGRAISSVNPHVSEVVIIDGGSTDGTREEAVRAGARVVENPWPGYAAQRNFGAAQAAHDWIFMLDADEEVDSDLANFLRVFVTKSVKESEVFAFQRVGDFLGVMLPGNDRGQHVRLYNRRYHKYNDVKVHETVDATGDQIKTVKGIILHHGFRSISDHINRFNVYTDLEAQQRYDSGGRFSLMIFLLKPPARFFYQMLLRDLWRRGVIGIFVSLLWVYYDILVQMKLYERAANMASEVPNSK